MELNADFNARCAVHSSSMPWIGSPIPGVDRRMLDRLGDEVARATSIVRYAPNSQFSPHVHTGGEEFFVLQGVFQDEHGDFPAGTYIRNPPQSSHTPGSEPGCIIFVKLWQFDQKDRTHSRIDTNKMKFLRDGDHTGVEVMPLFKDDREDVVLERWQQGSSVNLTSEKGLELLVLEGSFEEAGEIFEPGSWLRLPAGSASSAVAGTAGARVWIKRDHLGETPLPPGG